MKGNEHLSYTVCVCAWRGASIIEWIYWQHQSSDGIQIYWDAPRPASHEHAALVSGMNMNKHGCDNITDIKIWGSSAPSSKQKLSITGRSRSTCEWPSASTNNINMEEREEKRQRQAGAEGHAADTDKPNKVSEWLVSWLPVFIVLITQDKNCTCPVCPRPQVPWIMQVLATERSATFQFTYWSSL